MNVATLELCKELFKLSGWKDTYLTTHKFYGVNRRIEGKELNGDLPAYDLGYLLRKLPKSTGSNYLLLEAGVRWNIGYAEYGEIRGHSGIADTPEDAAAKLCIELFKQGILK